MVRILVLMIGMLGCARPGLSTPTDPAEFHETSAERDARMKWWRQARFGMFIHWGVYAVPAGEWDGNEVKVTAEWIMNGADVPLATYERLARRFNPRKYDPAEWVRSVKHAGMKYVVITAKHHDGFALFNSRATDWDVVDATPWGTDLLRPLADECRRQGLRFGTYYSIMDWHHPAQQRNENSYDPTRIKPGRKQEYVRFMKLQLKELLDSCDPDVIWFDGEWPDWWTEDDGRDLYAYLRELKPALIVNNRVGKGRQGMEGLSKGDRQYVGDFGTPEQQVPPSSLPGVDWESCMTMNNSWGYHRYDRNWKSPETLIRNLVDVASKGGNYLLNVGPTADGEIPPESVERLAAIGRWMKHNAESIYATSASPLEAPPWGRLTSKLDNDGNTRLYLHVFDWPTDRKLHLAGLQNDVRQARLVATGEVLSTSCNKTGVSIAVPKAPVDPIDSVIVLELAGPIQVARQRASD